MLDVDRIRGLLATRTYGHSIEVLPQTSSTNDDARAAAERGVPRGHVVVADAQSRGRGSHGRAWSSPSGVDLYVSIVERLPISAEVIAPVTLAVGLGVTDAVRAVAPELEPRVKWPNDVWIGRRKCAGVLVEASSIGGRMGPLVIGIGLGVNRLEWDPELATSATSILRERGPSEPFDRSLVLATLLANIERWVDRFVHEGAGCVVDALQERLALRGERVRCDDIEGELLGVASNGGLRIRSDQGERTVIAGTLRPA